MPNPTPYPSDDEWWTRSHEKSESHERKSLIAKPTVQWGNGSILCCLSILILLTITPTVVIAAVVARVGLKIEEQATPFAEQAKPMIDNAQDIVRTASMTTRLIHQLINSTIPHTARIPQTVDMTLGTLNESKRLISRLANMAEHPPAVTLNVGG